MTSYSFATFDMTPEKRMMQVEDLSKRHTSFIKRDEGGGGEGSFRPKAQHRSSVVKQLAMIDNQATLWGQ